MSFSLLCNVFVVHRGVWQLYPELGSGGAFTQILELINSVIFFKKKCVASQTFIATINHIYAIECYIHILAVMLKLSQGRHTRQYTIDGLRSVGCKIYSGHHNLTTRSASVEEKPGWRRVQSLSSQIDQRSHYPSPPLSPPPNTHTLSPWRSCKEIVCSQA